MAGSGWDWGTVHQWLTLWLANVVEEVKDLTRAIANLSKSDSSRSGNA